MAINGITLLIVSLVAIFFPRMIPWKINNQEILKFVSIALAIGTAFAAVIYIDSITLQSSFWSGAILITVVHYLYQCIKH